MIEALIDYIQQKGCNVSVMTESLLLWKIAKGQRINKNWRISKLELNQIVDASLLFQEADRQIGMIDKAIEGYQP